MNRLSVCGFALGAWLIVLSVLAVPVSAMALENSEQGQVVVNVIDEKGVSFAGNWSLHRGSTVNGYPIVRNGAKGEDFYVDPGTYFLELQRPFDNRYEFKSIRSGNPQSVAAGEMITFNVQYFQTQDQKDAADAQPYAVKAPVSNPPAVQVTPKPAVAPTPAPVVKPVVKPKPTPAPAATVSPDTDRNTVSSAPVETVQADQPLQLAVTGPSGLWLLVMVSILMAGIAFRLKRA